VSAQNRRSGWSSAGQSQVSSEIFSATGPSPAYRPAGRCRLHRKTAHPGEKFSPLNDHWGHRCRRECGLRHGSTPVNPLNPSFNRGNSFGGDVNPFASRLSRLVPTTWTSRHVWIPVTSVGQVRRFYVPVDPTVLTAIMTPWVPVDCPWKDPYPK